MTFWQETNVGCVASRVWPVAYQVLAQAPNPAHYSGTDDRGHR